MRKEFQITNEQLQSLKKASQPTPAMYLSGGQPMFASPQENANIAWGKLGAEMGFDFMSVRPVAGKSQHFFTAEVQAATPPVVSGEKEDSD
jgi:aromatic ring-opening dioxygenase catalytic subunit (LigB family)